MRLIRNDERASVCSSAQAHMKGARWPRSLCRQATHGARPSRLMLPGGTRSYALLIVPQRLALERLFTPWDEH